MARCLQQRRFPMIRAVALIACVIPAAALAQSDSGLAFDMRAAHRTMHGQHMMNGMQPGGAVATQPGQAAFAAIQEIVQILVDDPKTDWSRVNIDALRQHLIDMNNMTLAAN